MIRVLFFIEKLEYRGSHGGAEKVLCDLINHMDRTKFDITLKTLWPCDFSKYLNQGVACSSIFPEKNWFYNAIYRFESMAGLVYDFHLKDDYDIECAYLECGTTKIMAGSSNKKATKICWVHCDFCSAWDNPQRFVKKSKKWYEKFDAVACVSQTARESYISLFGQPEKAYVLYNTIDDQLIRSLAKSPLDNDLEKRKRTVVSVGRLDSPKNYLRMLKACARLRNEGYDFDLWILGKGEQQQLLEDYIQDNGLEDCVKLCGFRANPYAAIEAADILACSSNYEGFSTFITEGLILGKPIVTTDCSGMRELLGDSKYGLITENDDAAFCDGLRAMLSSEEMRASFERAAQKRGADFSTAALVGETEAFLMQILAEKN